MNDTPDDPRDPELSRLYRKASSAEPPPALDAAILAAARAAAAPQRTPRPWWRRLQTPFALAATIMLAVALTLSMDRNPPADAEIPAVKASRESAPAPKQAAPAREETQRVPAAPAMQNPVTSTSEKPDPAPSPAVPVASGASATTGMSARATDAASADTSSSARHKPIAEPGAAPAPEAKREAALPIPQAWLDEIRSLRRQGRTDEAARSLRDFRAAYPDYPLPEDLR